MTITILYFDGCPNWELARERVVEAVQLAGASNDIELRRVDSPEEAERVGFAGSPTILIDGADPFPTGTTGFACRLYSGDHAPSVAELVRVLTS
jgi:hypothetical protein